MATPADSFYIPESVEEAGALLGAAITRYGTNNNQKPFSSDGTPATPQTPKGMHSSFATSGSPLLSTELLIRLKSLRALLRSAPKDEPLVAAPSLLAGVLLKLLGVSSTLASAARNAPTTTTVATLSTAATTIIPPMLSTPLRKVWVDCVVLCHELGDGLSGTARMNLLGFLRNMMALAAMNPKTIKALGGNRVAALEVIAALFQNEKLAPKLSSWSLDIIQLSQRAMKSIGNGEPSYRVASLHASCAVAIACRISHLKSKGGGIEKSDRAALSLQGAMEDRAVIETVKLLRQAITDKYPEVRSKAATLAGLMAPVCLHIARTPSSSSGSSDPSGAGTSPTTSLEDIMTIAFKNLDDESAYVAMGWAEALTRCMSTAIEFQRTSRRDAGGGSPAPKDSGPGQSQIRKGVMPVTVCSTLPAALKYLVGHFVKVGGELTAPRAGGPYSVGGRALRIGFSNCLIELLRLQCKMDAIGDGHGVTLKEAIAIVLTMVGNDMQTQLYSDNKSTKSPVERLDATSDRVHEIDTGSNNTQHSMFGQGPKRSHADGGIARVATHRVLRLGLSDIASESTQISMLHELIQFLGERSAARINGNQLQVVLVEISHLLVALGEASASSMDDLIPSLKRMLRHEEHGVRHEAAIACAALTTVFPSNVRDLILVCANDIQIEHAELMKLASMKKSTQQKGQQSSESSASRLLRFRRTSTKKEVEKVDETLKHQYAIHGLSLMISVVVRDLPHVPGGLPVDLLEKVLSVAEILVSTLFNGIMTIESPSASCTCVRAGFGIICGGLSTGPNAVAKHIALIFGLWQKTCKPPTSRGPNFSSDHDLICIDALLSSILTFLNYCSELLLSIPDALSRTSIILEELLMLFLPNGRLGSVPQNPIAASRQKCAKASLMEAFAWLPPGSFPMIADSVFSFSAIHIQAASENNESCSILESLINKEDKLLDSMSFGRATRVGQVGGARDLEQSIIMLTSEAAHHGEREAVVLLHSMGKKRSSQRKQQIEFRGSEVLGMFIDTNFAKPPTPLHEVGTWRAPIQPSCSSKVRLIDAAIQAFAATFSLKSGKEQQMAMVMLESLLPQAEQDRRAKTKTGNAAVTNTAAVVLSCLKALPIHEATHNVPIGLGPQWMSKAKDLLLTLLPASCQEVRRAAAEGLGLLATLGVSEDAHFLQSTVLHSLDAVMQGNQPDGKPRVMPPDAVSAARSGAVLTLACIQRTAHNIQQKRLAKGRSRDESKSDSQLPTFQMITRVLPSLTCQGVRDFFSVRTHALHSFGVLLTYSNRLKPNKKNISPDDVQLLKKAIELVEENCLAAWTLASTEYDRGHAAEKLAGEASFLSVLLRTMSMLVPSLHHLRDNDPGVASRFSDMATVIFEFGSAHPMVLLEVTSFFEVLALHQHLLPLPSTNKVLYSENPLLSCIPLFMEHLQPDLPEVLPTSTRKLSNKQGCLSSTIGLRAVVRGLQRLTLTQVSLTEWSDMEVVSLLYASLENICASRLFTGDSIYRSFAVSRTTEMTSIGGGGIEIDLAQYLSLLLHVEHSLTKSSSPMLMRWILLSRVILMGVTSTGDDDNNNNDDGDDGFGGGGSGSNNNNNSNNRYTMQQVMRNASAQALTDSYAVFECASSLRWQVKALAIQLATNAINELVEIFRANDTSLAETSEFNPKIGEKACAVACREAESAKGKIPPSFLAFHLSDLVTAACATSISTVDQSELRMLQENAIHMLTQLIIAFGRIPDPDEPNMGILSEYLPQLSSCIKNALGSALEERTSQSCRLFIAGCQSLHAAIDAQLTSDRLVLRRLVRGALPTVTDMSFFDPREGLSRENTGADDSNSYVNQGALLLLKIGQVWTVGKLLAADDTLLSDMEADKTEVAGTAAALCIDGACLLTASRLSLAGMPIVKESDDTVPSGFFYDNPTEVDHFVKSKLVSTWATCGHTALRFLSEAIIADDRAEVCSLWFEKVLQLLFIGVHHCLTEPSTNGDNIAGWAHSIVVEEILMSCLNGLTVLLESATKLPVKKEWEEGYKQVVLCISERVLLPILGSESPNEHSSDETKSDLKEKVLSNVSEVVTNAGTVNSCCKFIMAYASSAVLNQWDNSSLLIALLGPLNILQNGSLTNMDKNATSVLSACLVAVGMLVKQGKTPPALVNVMLSLSLKVLTDEKAKSSESLLAATRDLLGDCLNNNAITNQEISLVATEMAKAKIWDAWLVACSIYQGAAASNSLEVVGNYLLDTSSCDSQLAVLAAVRELITSVKPPSPLISQIVFGLGAEVLSVLRAFGCLTIPKDAQSNRTTACADCMKVVLVGFQQLQSETSQEQFIASFLVVMFESLLAVIKYNGLPNNPLPQTQSDPALGRMCAQAILHVARTTPAPFKSSVASMSEQDRALLEFAVRAEMTGYASASSQAPVKKKLNLQSFKK